MWLELRVAPGRHGWEVRCVGSRQWLSLRGAVETFQQWHSQPCISVVPSSLPHQTLTVSGTMPRF